MKFLGFTALLLIAVIALLMLSVGIQVYIMWTLSGAKPYKLSGANNNTVDQKGKDAAEYWKENKIWMIVPTVGNVIGMALLGLMFVMS